jgi:pimeloyl-ACP methyl ester carboxylesterase
VTDPYAPRNRCPAGHPHPRPAAGLGAALVATLVATLLVVVAGVVAAAAVALAARPAAAQDGPVLPREAPAGTGAVEACSPPGVDGSARCGVFRVWEDRAARSGPTLDLAFVILEAMDPDRRRPDPVLLLPGGPGQPFVQDAAGLARGMAAFRERRDILLVDVRGVGRSGGLSCDVPFPRGQHSRFGALFPLDHARRCRDALAERARLELYTTAHSVDDVEELRVWLGYPPVNIDATSYGTRVAQVYLRRHPTAVRTAVLTGVAPVSRPLYVRHAATLRDALDRLVDECAGQTACSAAYPGLRADLSRLLARFADGPVPVRLEAGEVAFAAGDLAYAIRGLLYGRGSELPGMVARAAHGDLRPLVEYYLERTAWVGDPDEYAGYHFSVLCAEDIRPVTDAEIDAETAGTFMGDHLIRSYRAVCDLWPAARLPSGFLEPVHSSVPTLLVSGSRDPVTPPEGADLVAGTLSRSLHVVVPGAGHGAWGPCVEGLVLELQRTGSVDSLDPSCLQAVPPTEFVLPPR